MKVKWKEDATGGRKNDEGKPPMWIVPLDTLAEVAKVMEHGAKEYGMHNWKSCDPSRFRSALLRHMLSVQNGELIDSKSGLLHDAHIATNALFILWHSIKEAKGE